MWVVTHLCPVNQRPCLALLLLAERRLKHSNSLDIFQKIENHLDPSLALRSQISDEDTVWNHLMEKENTSTDPNMKHSSLSSIPCTTFVAQHLLGK